MNSNNLPKVDLYAINSDESVRAVESFFCQRNSFIPRPEKPDYGVDLNIELIVDDYASSYIFPIQIKSTVIVKEMKFDDVIYITLSFPVKTLIYLSQRLPAYGLIIIYDVTNQKCYYEYVEEVHSRINKERNYDETWHKQENVQIRIPKSNILNQDSIKDIHRVFLERFQNHARLVQDHGAIYNIPILQKKDSALSPIEFLRKYGFMLLELSNAAYIHNLIQSIPTRDFVSDSKLVLIAVIAYSNIGMCVDAEYYIGIARRYDSQYQQNEKDLLRFAKLRIDYLLGRNRGKSYYASLKDLSESTENLENKLILKLNILSYKLLNDAEFSTDYKDLSKEAFDFFETLETASVEIQKRYSMMMSHVQNIILYESKISTISLGRLAIKERPLELNLNKERFEILQETERVFDKLRRIIVKCLLFARSNEDHLLEATASFKLGMLTYSREFTRLIFTFQNPSIEEELKLAYQLLLAAAYRFRELSLLNDYRLSLAAAHELAEISRIKYKLSLSTVEETESIIKVINSITNKMGLEEEFDDTKIQNMWNKYQEILNTPEDQMISELSEDQIHKYGLEILKAIELPNDRLENIKRDLRASSVFHKVVGDSDTYILLNDNSARRNTSEYYKYPSEYIILNKKTQMQTLPNTDIEYLLKQLNLIK
jgi:mRNA-degrading endonuclease YafQ of YafQ-DinJ toxin-antitoxin module